MPVFERMKKFNSYIKMYWYSVHKLWFSMFNFYYCLMVIFKCFIYIKRTSLKMNEKYFCSSLCLVHNFNDLIVYVWMFTGVLYDRSYTHDPTVWTDFKPTCDTINKRKKTHCLSL